METYGDGWWASPAGPPGQESGAPPAAAAPSTRPGTDHIRALQAARPALPPAYQLHRVAAVVAVLGQCAVVLSHLRHAGAAGVALPLTILALTAVAMMLILRFPAFYWANRSACQPVDDATCVPSSA